MKFRNALPIGLAAFFLVSLFLLGSCGDAGGAAKTKAPVKLIVSQINDNEAYQCDVLDADGNIPEDVIGVQFELIQLGPDEDEFTGDKTMLDVYLREYHVSFSRTDTGTSVPVSFSARHTIQITLDGGGGGDFILSRASQKLMPPLSYLIDLGYEPETGLTEIHTNALYTFVGFTNSGIRVTAEASLPVNFADWGDV